MRPYVEYVLENDGVRIIDSIEFAPDAMEEHARDALTNEAVQVTFVDQHGKETVFERTAA